MKTLPSVADLQRLFRYDENAGGLVWACGVRQGHRAGALVAGYRRVNLKHNLYYEHRLVIKLVDGYDPPDEIDHINGIRDDNRRSNLRFADRFENNRNVGTKKQNKSGYKGVYWHSKNKSWSAMIRVGGKQRHLGCFPSPELAHVAYRDAALLGHGNFARF